MIHYGLTKTAQIALARGLAEMTAGTNVTVNSFLAGPTRSEGVEKFVDDMAKSQGTDEPTVENEFFRSIRPTSLLKRLKRPRKWRRWSSTFAVPSRREPTGRRSASRGASCDRSCERLTLPSPSAKGLG